VWERRYSLAIPCRCEIPQSDGVLLTRQDAGRAPRHRGAFLGLQLFFLRRRLLLHWGRSGGESGSALKIIGREGHEAFRYGGRSAFLRQPDATFRLGSQVLRALGHRLEFPAGRRGLMRRYR
jgi:hypothetical protein